MLRRRRLLQQLRVHHADALNWALICCDYDREMAGDVLRTVYVKVLEGNARFAGRAMLRTWLLGVVRNAAREVRRNNVALLVPLPDKTARQSEMSGSDVIDRAMDELSDMQRQVIYLVFHREFTLEGAASILDANVGSIRRHYHRAKQKIGSRLASNDQSDVEKPYQSIL